MIEDWFPYLNKEFLGELQNTLHEMEELREHINKTFLFVKRMDNNKMFRTLQIDTADCSRLFRMSVENIENIFQELCKIINKYKEVIKDVDEQKTNTKSN